jgi:hypothetical protein
MPRQMLSSSVVARSLGAAEGVLTYLSTWQHRLYFPDGGKRMRDLAALSGEPILPLSEWVLAQGDKESYDLPGLWEVRRILTDVDRENLSADVAVVCSR